MQLSQAEMCRSMQHALFSHLNIRLSFYISRWLFLVISSYLILRSRRVVNDPIRYSYCAEFGIFVCRGWLSFVWLQHQGQQFCWIILLALYGTLKFLQWYTKSLKVCLIVDSYFQLARSFHTNSFLCQQKSFASGLYSLLLVRPGRVTTLPLLPTSAVRLCGHLRRLLQRWLAPATPWRLPSGTDALSDALAQ